ncbi:MAG: hypothetical protein ACTSUK_01720 [Promethearchaeota archaeon]
MITYQYSVEAIGLRLGYGEFSVYSNDHQPEQLAEIAAMNFFINKDKEDVLGPIEFVIFRGDKELGEFIISINWKPVFSATRK